MPAEGVEKEAPVVVIMKNVLPAVSPRHDVVICPCGLNADAACHAPVFAPAAELSSSCTLTPFPQPPPARPRPRPRHPHQGRSKPRQPPLVGAVKKRPPQRREKVPRPPVAAWRMARTRRRTSLHRARLSPLHHLHQDRPRVPPTLTRQTPPPRPLQTPLPRRGLC